MPEAIREHDVIVVPASDAMNIAQVLQGQLRHLEGPYTQVEAEFRALALAREHDSDAWMKWRPGDVYTLLSD